MKKGISSLAFSGSMTLKEIFIQAKQYGFEGVELWLDPNGPVYPDITEKELEVIKNDASEAGIVLYSLAATVYWGCSLVSDNEDEREQAKEYVKAQLRIASYLGCETILVIPGHTGVVFAPALGIVDYETAYERAVKAAKELAPYAQKAGVVIGMENVWNKFLMTPIEMRTFIDEVGSPWVQSYFDVGNVLLTSYPEHWIKILGSRISKVHFKDFKMSIGNLDGFCDLLTGDVNYKAVMDAFKSVGYDGWTTCETGPYATDNTINLKHISEAMDYIHKL